jgi:hypothetical protein
MFSGFVDNLGEVSQELNDLLVREKAKVAELQHDLLIAQKSLRTVTAKVYSLQITTIKSSKSGHLFDLVQIYIFRTDPGCLVKLLTHVTAGEGSRSQS